MKLLALLGAAGALAAPAAGPEVAMPGQFYAPRTVDALVGETVTWRNSDHSAHTVTADDDTFDSGAIRAGASFSRTFDSEGTFRFHCTIHRFMRGVVRVHALVLRAPEKPVAAGAQATLSGLAGEGGAEVVLERGGAVVASTRADAEGRFAFRVAAERGPAFRVRSGGAASAEVTLSVRPKVTLGVMRHGEALMLTVTATPSRAGAYVQLQSYSRLRFAWDRYAHARIGRDGTAELMLEPKRKLYVRAVVLAVDGYADGTSGTVVLRPHGRSGPATGSGHAHGH